VIELRVDVAAVANQQIREAESWWKQNRPAAPGAIAEELERASTLIASQPRIGTRARNVALPGVRRLYIARIRYYLFYRVADDPPRIEILSLWHASRGSGPPL